MQKLQDMHEDMMLVAVCTVLSGAGDAETVLGRYRWCWGGAGHLHRLHRHKHNVNARCREVHGVHTHLSFPPGQSVLIVVRMFHNVSDY